MLSDIQFESKKIVYRGSDFTVRGLGLDIIARLLASGTRTQIDAALAQIAAAQDAKKAGDSKAIDAALMGIATGLPELVAKVIALCADEPDAEAVVAKLPLPVQVEALIAIGQLTFDGEESIKNFVSGLMTLMGSVKGTVSIAGQIAATGIQS